MIKNSNIITNKTKVYLSIFTVTIILFFSAIRVSADPADKELDKELMQALDAFYKMDYQLSEDMFDDIIEKNPQNPLPYLIKGGYYLERYRFHKDFTKEEKSNIKENFINLNEKVISLSTVRLEKDPEDLDATFYLGAANGNLGRFYMITKQWWKGYWAGKKGFNLCKEVADKSPDYYDAYLGLGIFHYVSATLPKVVKTLSFLLGGPDGDKDRGLRELKIVRENSKLLSVEARRLLLGVAHWEKDWDSYYSTSKWLTEHYPENIAFSTYYIYALLHNNQIDKAVEQLDKVNSLIKDDPNNLPTRTRTKYYTYKGFLHYTKANYPAAIQSYLDAIKLSKEDKPFEKIWDEDFFCLATCFAYESEEEMAFEFLKKAFNKGQGKDEVLKHPAWQKYKTYPKFIKIVGSRQ